MELLTHTSVIPGQLQLYRHAHSRADLLEAIRWQVPRADSPERVAYTSKGYIVLGEVVAAVDGMTLDQAVHNRVLAPLQMNDTCFRPPKEYFNRIAPTEDCPWRDMLCAARCTMKMQWSWAGSADMQGCFSTAADVSRIAEAMLGAQDGKTRKPFFHPAILSAMTRNYTQGKGENRGLGISPQWLECTCR